MQPQNPAHNFVAVLEELDAGYFNQRISAAVAATAIAALRRVKLEMRGNVVNVEDDFARSQSTLAAIEAKGDVDALPAYFIVNTPLYIGTVELEIVMRLGVREQDGKPVLALRIVGREMLIQTTAEWLEKTIANAFEGKPMSVYVGAITINKPV